MRKAHNSEIELIRVSLVDLRRLFQRRELVELWSAEAGAGDDLDYTELRLLDAIRIAEARHGAATVGDASRLLGVDPSRASRQVARAVAKGVLRRRAEQADGRKVLLEVTPKGAALQAKGSELTRARIGLALADWSDTNRARFAALFARFVSGIVSDR